MVANNPQTIKQTKRALNISRKYMYGSVRNLGNTRNHELLDLQNEF